PQTSSALARNTQHRSLSSQIREGCRGPFPAHDFLQPRGSFGPSAGMTPQGIYRSRGSMTLVSINSTVAYFSMEICLDQAIPTYSGGLGVLAGDTLRSAADLGVPMIGITLLHRKGYFEQHLDPSGAQTEQPVAWRPEDVLDLLPVSATVQIE